LEVSGQLHVSAALPQAGRPPISIGQEAGWEEEEEEEDDDDGNNNNNNNNNNVT
jgi:hypothetical protein